MNKLSSRPRFSVVIPCYNEENFIGDTLESLCNQVTEASYEIIVVDNNCNDNTVKIASAYPVKIVHEPLPGICSARQAGTKVARGEIIVSSDADTVFAPNWLENIKLEFERNIDAVAIGGPCRYYDGPWWANFYTFFLFRTNKLYSSVVGHPFYLTATNIAFKKVAWQGYDLNVLAGDELALLHQLRKSGRVNFNTYNPTFTSSRRLQQGLLYSIFVSFIFYYLFGYYVNLLFKRKIIGQPPAFRNNSTDLRTYMPAVVKGIFLMLILSLPLVVLNQHIKGFVTDNTHDLAYLIQKIF